ncbi:MAG: hypothetical protein AB7D36_00775 [Oscillospiraceae bacterium]
MGKAGSLISGEARAFKIVGENILDTGISGRLILTLTLNFYDGDAKIAHQGPRSTDRKLFTVLTIPCILVPIRCFCVCEIKRLI